MDTTEQSSSFFFINKGVIDKLISIVESRLEKSLADVERLILKNNHDMKNVRKDVVSIKKILKDPLLTAPVKIIDDDLRFFKNMLHKKPIESTNILDNKLNLREVSLTSKSKSKKPRVPKFRQSSRNHKKKSRSRS